MATRFRPLLVWVGVVAAFFVQTLVAVAIGGVLSQLPRRPIEIFAALLFLIGGVILLRGAGRADEEEAETEEEFGAKSAARQLAGWKVVTFAFTILFLAEWGDLSQILTASMVLRFNDPTSVFLGAFLGLAAVSGLAALLGRTLLQRIRLGLIRRIGGTVCLVLAAASVLQITGVL